MKQYYKTTIYQTLSQVVNIDTVALEKVRVVIFLVFICGIDTNPFVSVWRQVWLVKFALEGIVASEVVIRDL
jgi:hypothetical protein